MKIPSFHTLVVGVALLVVALFSDVHAMSTRPGRSAMSTRPGRSVTTTTAPHRRTTTPVATRPGDGVGDPGATSSTTRPPPATAVATRPPSRTTTTSTTAPHRRGSSSSSTMASTTTTTTSHAHGHPRTTTTTSGTPYSCTCGALCMSPKGQPGVCASDGVSCGPVGDEFPDCSAAGGAGDYACTCGEPCSSPTTGDAGTCGADGRTCAVFKTAPDCSPISCAEAECAGTTCLDLSSKGVDPAKTFGCSNCDTCAACDWWSCS